MMPTQPAAVYMAAEYTAANKLPAALPAEIPAAPFVAPSAETFSEIRTPSPAEAALQTVAATQRLLAERSISHRPPPPQPTTCCGRGCNGCVWEGYYTALAYWHEGAAALLG